MSMQNQRKILAQLKGSDKSVQIMLSKNWFELLQRITYMQIETIKKLSIINFSKSSSSESENTKVVEKRNSDRSVAVTLPNETNQTNEEKTAEPIADPINKKIEKPNTKTLESIYGLPQLFANIILKLKNKSPEVTFIPTPKWKINASSYVSKHSIISRTRHVLNSIATAESNTSRWRRIEDLLKHIDQYPDARHYAIKEGAIGILLKARRQATDDQTKASINEALAVLGHLNPLPGQGIRILSIDGGGTRGVLVIEMMKKLEELTGKRIHELFDYICGVSTGAILSIILGGYKKKSLDEISDLYKYMSAKIFTQSALKGTSNLVWSHSYYDTALWEKLLQENLGDKTFIKTARDITTPKFSAVSAVVNHATVMAYVFRNYTLPHRIESQYIGSHKHKLWEAARASAAAPSYFEEFKLDEFLHQDGGILVNNPCAVAIHEARQLWSNYPIQCVVSFGTGRIPNIICEDSKSSKVAVSSWKEKFDRILDSATDTEAVHIMLNDLLPDHIYFRFNPYLTEMLTIAEIRPEKIDQLEQDALMYIRRNEEKFQKVAHTLLKKRKVQQKISDWVDLQKKTYGL
ncbi:calcium-independent phospholipase A2-gamma-like isoform X2 [Prorops nasuta]